MFKSGFIAIAGRPNVGKSTLLNAILGEKVAITSSKPQTTRNRITGIRNFEDGQFIFLDTPGIHRTKVLENFLRFARQVPLEGGTLNLNAVVREVLDLTRRQAERSNVAVVVRLAELPPLSVTAAIRQALLNLVLNALQAMPDGGQLDVATRRADGWAEVTIADTGPGVAAGEELRIFKTFVTTRPDGTGLGLPISQRIVASHGGQITVANTPGSGATFTVAIPCS